MTSWVINVIRGARVGTYFLLLLLLATGQAWAQQSSSGNWRVHLAVGEVNWRSLPSAAGDDPWHPVQPDAILAPPAEVETAANARIELQRGEDWVRAGADTRLTLEDSPTGLFSLIRQAAGAVWYKVKSVAGRKFEVESRYLVATVKGTEFRVVLGSKGDLLAVTEGVVRATPRGGGEGLDVAAGQSVLATPSGLLLLVPPGGGDHTPPTPSPARPEPAPPAPGKPQSIEPTTGDVHGVNGEEKHNHGGLTGEGVRESHGKSRSENGGGAKARGPK